MALAAASWFYLASPNIRPGPDSGPLEAIAYAKNSKLNGNVFNHYNFGGPLIFNGIATYLDGRTDQLFLHGFTANDAKMQQPGGEKLLVEALRKYDIQWTLLKPDDPRVTFLDAMKDWRRAYSDEFAVIHVWQVGKAL